MLPDRKARSVTFLSPKKLSPSVLKASIESEVGEDSILVVQELYGGEFLVELRDEEMAQELIESGMDVESAHIGCHPPRGIYTSVSIMGLRAYVGNDEVLEALEPYGEIKSEVIRLKYKKDHVFSGVENGNRLVKMVLAKSIPYALKIDGNYCKIIHSDQKRVCNECGEEGHTRNKCPNIVCRRCQKKGHIARHCNDFREEETTDGNEETRSNKDDRPQTTPQVAQDNNDNNESKDNNDEDIDEDNDEDNNEDNDEDNDEEVDDDDQVNDDMESNSKVDEDEDDDMLDDTDIDSTIKPGTKRTIGMSEDEAQPQRRQKSKFTPNLDAARSRSKDDMKSKT